MRFKTLLFGLWALSLSFNTLLAQTQRLEGRVLLSDSLSAASFATVYLPNSGQGAVCDREGRFVLEDIVASECPVEVSYVGYSTHREVIHFDDNHQATLQVTMQEEPINLANVFITPNGEDAATYLLRKVLNQSKINRKRIQHLEANVQSSIYAQDLDFIPLILPKFLFFVCKSAIKMAGYGALVDLLFKHPVVDIDFRYQIDLTKGKLKYQNDKFVKMTPKISDKSAKDCYKIFHYDPIEDPVTLVESVLKYVAKAPDKYRLIGTIEEQGHVVDILEHKSMKGDTLVYSTRFYIMEDVWCLLRYETKSEMAGDSRLEFRNIGEDIYLPVLRVTNPAPIPLDLNDLLEEAKKSIAEDNEKPSSMESSILKRLEEVVNSGRKFQPYISQDFSIQYNNVSISQ